MAEAVRQQGVSKQFTLMSFVWRFLAALALVLATYNPSTWSYFHWVTGVVGESDLGAIHFFVGVILLAGWAILVVATRSSLDLFGMLIIAALLGTGTWLLIDLGALQADTVSSFT